MISQSELLRLVSYDPKTGIFTWKVSGGRMEIGSRAGGVKPHGYEMIGLNYHRYYSHRLAWLYITGQWPNGQIDHINGDRLDNRFSNLRQATHQENQRNRRKQRNNRSGVPGVHWANRERRWVSRIKVNGRMRHIGTFAKLSDAIVARKFAEHTYFGEFARKGEAK